MIAIFTGCCCSNCTNPTGNPAANGETPSWRGGRWTAPPSVAVPDTPVDPSEEEVEDEWATHKGPWKAAELIDIALKNNPATMESWEKAKTSAYLWKASKSPLYPSILLNEELMFQNVTGSIVGDEEANTTDNSANAVNAAGSAAKMLRPKLGAAAASSASGDTPAGFNYNQWVISTLSFSYLLLDFGGRQANIESARQALFAANWTHNRNMQTVILDVLLDYYRHLEALALYAARQEDLKNSEENFRAAEGQFMMGVVKKLDMLLAKSNLANAQLLLEQQKGFVQTSMGQLANSLGLPANRIFEVEKLPEDILLEKIQGSIDELIAVAKVERPDLAAAEATWKVQRENAVVTWSGGMPTITANGYVQQNSNIHHPAFNSGVQNGTIMLNVPLFNGFYFVNQTKAANANAAAAYAAWKAQEENVILDVVISYYTFTTAVETVKFSQEYFEYTDEAYRIAFEGYRSGVGNFLDVLAAQAALSNARAQKIIARTQWITALTNVAYATGSL